MVGWWRAEGNATDSALDNDGTFMNGATTGAGFVGDLRARYKRLHSGTRTPQLD
jgi:hypothetical protein